MSALLKGTKIRVDVGSGRKVTGKVSRDQLAMHPYVTYRDDRTGGEHTTRVEKVELA